MQPAVANDSEAIATVHGDTLIHTYHGVSPEEMKRRYEAFGSFAKRVGALMIQIASSEPGHAVLVTADGTGDIAGFTITPADIRREGLSGCALCRTSAYRQGLGTRLLRELRLNVRPIQ